MPLQIRRILFRTILDPVRGFVVPLNHNVTYSPEREGIIVIGLSSQPCPSIHSQPYTFILIAATEGLRPRQVLEIAAEPKGCGCVLVLT